MLDDCAGGLKAAPGASSLELAYGGGGALPLAEVGAHMDDRLDPEKDNLSGAPTWSSMSGTLSSSAS